MDNEIIDYILNNTHPSVYRKCLANFETQWLYECKKNYLLANYFDGHQMKYSVEMARIFRQFGTSDQLQRLRDLRDEIKESDFNTKLARKFRPETAKEKIEAHNLLIDEYNEIQKGSIEILRKRYNKILKAKSNGK